MAERIPILAVVGPTASGKTALSVALAKYYDAEILSFDSMQIYKGMDIATAKPTVKEMEGIPHHMIGVIDPNDSFNVAEYKKCADEIIKDITERGKRVIMVGGTGLYLDTVVNNIEFLPSSNDASTMDKLKDDLSTFGPEVMYKRLLDIDPDAAAKIHPNNTGRVLRALQVYMQTGHTMTYQVENSKNIPSLYDAFYLGLTARNRAFLYKRVDERVDAMLENGLLFEAKQFVGAGTSRQAIGIKELLPFLKEESTLEACVSKLKQETRRYAKRQLTWFRRNEAINWICIDEVPSKEELVSRAIKIVDESGLFKNG